MGDGVRETGKGVRDGERLWMMYLHIGTRDAGTACEEVGTGKAMGTKQNGVDGEDDDV
jgi:hypothetical protein